jgi:flagellar basal-body rod protein FlgB
MFDNPTLDLVSSVLDMTMDNHNYISSNIANANTPSYKAVHVDFESMLKDVKSELSQAQGGASSSEAFTDAVKDLDNRKALSIDEQSVGVMLDKEIVHLAQNTLKYKALITARSQLSSLMSTAIKGK